MNFEQVIVLAAMLLYTAAGASYAQLSTCHFDKLDRSGPCAVVPACCRGVLLYHK